MGNIESSAGSEQNWEGCALAFVIDYTVDG